MEEFNTLAPFEQVAAGPLTATGVEESVNVLADYRQAFGQDPPAMAGLAVMSDTDNTGSSAVAYLDFIEVGQ